MRPSCCAVLFVSIASLSIGCHQAPNASSPLTPVGALVPQGQLAPVSQTSGVGPFGGRTRVAPPGTGSYLVPNNYMGGTVGQTGFPTSAVNTPSQPGGVSPAGWNQVGPTPGVAPTSFGAGFGAAAGANPATGPMQPNLGGMRVNDLTNAPPPPGYYPQQTFSPDPNTRPSIQQPNIPQQSFSQPGFGDSFRSDMPIPSQPRSTVPVDVPRYFPDAEIASAGAQQFPGGQNFNGGPQANEFPMQPAPTQPSFRGAAQFQTGPPSTEPVQNQQPQAPDLPWRRPY